MHWPLCQQVFVFLFFCRFFVALAGAPVQQIPRSSELLTAENWESHVPHGWWLVEFFSPYCAHCAEFAPTWTELINTRGSMTEENDLHFAQVDCTLQGDLCDTHKVKGYPNLILYKNGNRIGRFKGERTFASVSGWLDENVSLAPKSPPLEETHTAIKNINNEIVSEESQDDVVTLTEENFSQISRSPTPLFVKFYAPWCAHCKQLAPTWKDLATLLKGSVTVAQVNCDEQKTLCRSQDIKGYPTLNFYSEEDKVEYSGSRALSELEGFAKKIVTATGFREVGPGEMERLIREEEVVFLYLFSESTSEENIQTVKSAARSLLGEAPVYRSKSPELLDRYNIPQSESMLLVFKDGMTTEIGKISVSSKEDMAAWMKKNQLPTLGQLTASRVPLYFGETQEGLVVAGILRQDRITVQGGESAKSRLRETAHSWARRGRVYAKFIWIDANAWSQWLKKSFDIKADGPFTRLIVIDPKNMDYYDVDKDGHKVGFEETAGYTLLAEIQAGTAPRKHSRNKLQRAVLAINSEIESYIVTIGNYPITSLSLFVVVSIVLLATSMWGRRRSEGIVLGDIKAD